MSLDLSQVLSVVPLAAPASALETTFHPDSSDRDDRDLGRVSGEISLSPPEWFSISVCLSKQAVWLSQAYNLEIAGTGGYLPVWIAGLGFFLGQVWVLKELLVSYR